MKDVFIGLGSNLGDREENIARALEVIVRLPETRLIAVSEIVETEPWGIEDQPLFANAVARFATSMTARAMLRALKNIEAELGRVPGRRNGPRVIDLDILLFGDEVWETEDLTIPHPRLGERDFALTPLLEIAPAATWPDGTPLLERGRATEGRIVRRLGPAPGFEHLTVRPDGD